MMDTVYDLQMFADDDDDTDATAIGDAPGDSGTTTEESKTTQKLLTPEETAKIMAREVQRGRRQALKEVEKQFGVKADEAKAILDIAGEIQGLAGMPLADIREFLRKQMQVPARQPVLQQTYTPTQREPERDPEEEADHEFLRKQRTEEKPLNELRQQIGDDVFNELLPQAEELATEEGWPIVSAFRYLLPKEMPKIIAKQRASAEASAYEKFKDGRIYTVEPGSGAAASMERAETLSEKEEKARQRVNMTRKEWIDWRKSIAHAKAQDDGKGAPNIETYRQFKNRNKTNKR